MIEFVFLLLAPTLLWAGGVSDSVVKLTSAFNTMTLQPRSGSGLVIQWRGHNYVLTSDHVAYHSNRSFTHEITDSFGHKAAVEYFAADAGMGLALLRFPTENANFISCNLEQTSEKPPVLQENISMIGYPADSDGVLIDKKGKLSNLKFLSEIFVELPELMEVRGGHGEFGMSGGAAFSAEGYYRGLLSHQIVSGAADSVLVIPAPLVRAWLSSVLAVDGTLQNPSPIDLFQDSFQQVSDFTSYRSGNMFFAFSQPYGQGSQTALTAIPGKTKFTEFPYGGTQGPFANLKFKPKGNVMSMGLRAKKVLGNFAGAPSTPTAWLRQALDPQIEILWTYSDDHTVINVRKARSYQKDFQNLATRLDKSQTVRLANYAKRIALLLEFTPADDSTTDSRDEQATGAWRFIKPTDLDYILNDLSLQSEWSAAAAEGAQQFRLKLSELRNVMTELTF